MFVKELDELLNLNRSGKKLNQESREHYRRVLFELLVENQAPSELANYIVNGAAVGGAKAFCEYILTQNESQKEKILIILRSKDFVTSKATAQYRFVLLLFAEFIKTNNQHDEIYGVILNWIPHTVKKKDGEYISELSSYFKLYFLDEISLETIMPNIGALGLPESVINEVIAIIELSLSNLATKKKGEIAKKKALENWVSQYLSLEDSEDSASAVVSSKETVYAAKVVSKEEFSQKDESKHAQLLMDLAHEWTQLEASNLELSKNVDRLRNELSNVQKHVTVLQVQVVSSTDTINNLNQQLIKLQNENDNLKQVNMNLESRITRQSSVLSVYSEDKENSMSEQLNSIASALVRSYKEYREVTPMTLSTDMEMNLLDLLEEVFRKLKKCGIDIEGRL